MKSRSLGQKWDRLAIALYVLILSLIFNFVFYSADALGKLTHIRLDRLEITKVDNLECLGPVTNLYLQQVRIFPHVLSNLY
jgi:hypothetical protein